MRRKLRGQGRVNGLLFSRNELIPPEELGYGEALDLVLDLDLLVVARPRLGGGGGGGLRGGRGGKNDDAGERDGGGRGRGRHPASVRIATDFYTRIFSFLAVM